MLLLKMIVDVEPLLGLLACLWYTYDIVFWLPCPFLTGLLDGIPSDIEENSICKIEGLEKCWKLQKSWPQTHKLRFPFQFKQEGHTGKGIRHSYSAVEKSRERETAEILTESRTKKFFDCAGIFVSCAYTNRSSIQAILALQLHQGQGGCLKHS